MRLATKEDISLINALMNKAYRGDTAKQGWTHEADLLGGIRTDEDQLAASFESGLGAFYLYEEGFEALGCIYLETQGQQLYLGSLTVDPIIQGKGIGKKMLYFAEDIAKEKHCTSIIMTVISIRSELINWYKRHGYKDTGIKKPFPMDDPNFGIPKQELEFVLLEKTL